MCYDSKEKSSRWPNSANFCAKNLSVGPSVVGSKLNFKDFRYGHCQLRKRPVMLTYKVYNVNSTNLVFVHSQDTTIFPAFI